MKLYSSMKKKSIEDPRSDEAATNQISSRLPASLFPPEESTSSRSGCNNISTTNTMQKVDRGTSISRFCTALQEGDHTPDCSIHADDENILSMKAENSKNDHKYLDDEAENAATSFFGARADQPMKSSIDSGLRSSKLVSNGPGIDPSVFASRGLMSRRSFERYKKELKKKVMKAASSNSLKCIGSTKGMRRASTSMCDLIRNDSFEEITPSPSNKIGRSSIKQRPHSSSMNSAAVADVEHDLIATLISSFKNAHGGKSEGADKAPHDTLLTADEMVVLKNMMRRLSQGAPPTHFPSMQDLIQRGPSENDLCSSSSEEESLSPREDMRRPSKDAQKDEKRKYPSALLSDSHPDASSLQSLEGDTNREKGVFLNEVNFSGEPSSFKQGHRNHPIQEVELNRWQSGTSASMLSPPQFVKDTSIGSISTGVIAIASIKPLNVSDMKRDATDIKTYGGKFVDTDMEDKAQQIQVDGDTDRTPSMPQVRRSATSESMTRRPSTHGNMNKKMSSSSVIEVTNHAHSCAMGRTSSSSLFSTSTSDLNGPPFKQDCGDILAEG
ncbi:hypothetical protein ACHAXM_000144, partial [Skeletonema potamos]